MSFVNFKNKEGVMSTKTAILSIADLKAEDLSALRSALQVLPGVEKIDFSLERSVAVLEFDPAQSHIDDFLRAVLKAGFQVL
jgi:copper chaperone CopZ